ncbi:transcriptional repressor [Pseudooceanicola sp. CBS1P-1]|uniref:Transcriptional repressor n=1 Tax=Pseudooceanicola albus TaxID=2692189 RepID=A0A6L7GBM4_9RHOB|nr:MULTISPECIES: transcriptional repressor [Pseudooceanicola]MBT9386620.1 transcriptional repressor [Pseudooceanicola endophyticus]MXN20736.1 transcriptional repressor [Pseudooceanicola albus]
MTTPGEQMQADVLAILRRRNVALSAYKVLEALRDAHPKIAPPAVYRALSSLTSKGQAHRVESLKAYVACQSKVHASASILSICESCGYVEEHLAGEVVEAVSHVVAETGFSSQHHVIEVHGICAACNARMPAPEGVGAGGSPQ